MRMGGEQGVMMDWGWVAKWQAPLSPKVRIE